MIVVVKSTATSSPAVELVIIIVAYAFLKTMGGVHGAIRPTIWI